MFRITAEEKRFILRRRQVRAETKFTKDQATLIGWIASVCNLAGDDPKFDKQGVSVAGKRYALANEPVNMVINDIRQNAGIPSGKLQGGAKFFTSLLKRGLDDDMYPDSMALIKSIVKGLAKYKY